MLAEERRRHIIEILHCRDDGAVSVAELTEKFGVTGMTIRRDLDWLEGRSLLKRVHGGAVVHDGLYEQLADEPPFSEREDRYFEQKQSIGRAAVQLVQDGDRLILDAGTTTLQVARYLTGKRGLTVVTNALPVAEELTYLPDLSTIVLGGILKPRELCMVGPTVTAELTRLSVDRVFLSAAGFSVDMGISDPDLQEAEAKQAMIRASKEVVLVADSSKWNANALAQVAPLRVVHCIVTDDGISPDAVVAIQAEGVEVLTPASLARSGTFRQWPDR
jgi:DeoR/GlpR family transcriptional regulator of sugar metabolism